MGGRGFESRWVHDGKAQLTERKEGHHRRKHARYWICRDLGLGSREARAASNRAALFVEVLIAHGRDPAVYGDLARRLGTGSRGSTTERSARYWVLRARGLGADDAGRFAHSPGVFRDAVRRLDQGLPLRG